MELDLSEFEKYADDIASRYPVIAIESAVPAMESMADYLLGQVPEYPSETLGRLLPPDGVSWLRTRRQRAWFFASVREGTIPGWKWVDGHPEKVGGARTGNLGRAQGREVEQEGNEVTATLGFDPTIAPYAPWVVGEDFPGSASAEGPRYQARIHVDRWWQFGDIILENTEQGWKVFEESFWEHFSQAVNKEK